jgi:hypothetical protein
LEVVQRAALLLAPVEMVVLVAAAVQVLALQAPPVVLERPAKVTMVVEVEDSRVTMAAVAAVEVLEP